jgi:hypothetical protein
MIFTILGRIHWPVAVDFPEVVFCIEPSPSVFILYLLINAGNFGCIVSVFMFLSL